MIKIKTTLCANMNKNELVLDQTFIIFQKILWKGGKEVLNNKKILVITLFLITNIISNIPILLNVCQIKKLTILKEKKSNIKNQFINSIISQIIHQ